MYPMCNFFDSHHFYGAKWEKMTITKWNKYASTKIQFCFVWENVLVECGLHLCTELVVVYMGSVMFPF